MAREYITHRTCIFTLVVSLFLQSLQTNAQQNPDSLLRQADLPNIIQYALKRQPAVEQSLVDERITELQIKSRLSEWYPQVNFGYLYQHNFKVQTSVIGGN